MFVPCTDLPSLSQSSLRCFRVSINAPEVRAGDGPPGPVRAAIVAHALSGGGFALTILLRPLDGGEPGAFVYKGKIAQEKQIAPLVEEAHAFGEDLGFVFDDDMVDSRNKTGRDEAIACWRELLRPGRLEDALEVDDEVSLELLGDEIVPGEHERLLSIEDSLPDASSELDPPDSESAAAPTRARSGDGDLLLEEMMDLTGADTDGSMALDVDGGAAPASDPGLSRFRLDSNSADGAGDDAPASERPARRGRTASHAKTPRKKARPTTSEKATKKRAAAKDAGASAVAKNERRERAERRQASDDGSSASGRALGRIAIVKRRAGSESEPASLLARLLASF